MEPRQGLPAPRLPRTSHCSLCTGQFAPFVLALALLFGGCASPGEPIERKALIPQPVADLTAAQIGNGVVLTFTLPKETVDRRSLDHPPTIEVFRDFVPAAAMSTASLAKPPASTHPTLQATIPPAVVDNYTEQGRVHYADPLQPEDFTQHPDSAVVYIVRTRASAKKESADSNVVVLGIHPAADPIEDLKAEVTHSGIEIIWTPPQETPVGPVPQIASYRIYRAESQPTPGTVKPAPSATTSPSATSVAEAAKLTSPFVKIGETETATYLDTQFELGKTYVYTVRSVVRYGAGQIESADSNSFVVLARDVSPPATPRGLIAVYVPAQGNLPAHLELSWSISPETDLAGYNVYRSEQASLLGTRANNELLLTPAFRDMNAAPGRNYFYSVTAVDRSGNESPASAAAPGTVPAESQPMP